MRTTNTIYTYSTLCTYCTRLTLTQFNDAAAEDDDGVIWVMLGGFLIWLVSTKNPLQMSIIDERITKFFFVGSSGPGKLLSGKEIAIVMQ